MSFHSGMSLARGAFVAVALAAALTVTDIPSAFADQPTPVCSEPGGGLWSHTSDGPASACSTPAGQPASFTDAVTTTGRTQGGNPGTPGQCTWGAAQKWFEASGSYPALLGNAEAWGNNAAAAGWTVVDSARDRSIVVFPPGVAGATGYGHVAWVDSVTQRADGRWIHVTEMNNTSLGGPGIFNGRDVKEVSGMSYILLP